MTESIPDVTERAPSLDRNGRTAYRVTTDDLDLTTTIVAAVSEVAGTDPLEGSEVLYDCVDPDALDRLFRDREETASAVNRVEFDLRGCRVEVRADGQHVIYAPVDGPDENRGEATGSA